MNRAKLRVILSLVAISWCIAACGQKNVQIELNAMDAGMWAYKQHNAICETIYENIHNNRLATYNSQNIKESNAAALKAIALENISDDGNEEVVEKHAIIKWQKGMNLNFFFFKIAKDYVLLKPFKNKTNLLRFNKAELMTLLNAEEQLYMKWFTSAGTLHIDSIPEISWRIFIHIDNTLFNFSKSDESLLYRTSAMDSIMNKREKTENSHYDKITFVNINPDDPFEAGDSTFKVEYSVTDTLKRQAVLVTLSLEQLQLKALAVSVGMDVYYQSTGGDDFKSFGYLSIENGLPWNEEEKAWVFGILYIKVNELIDESYDLRNHYADYFNL